MKAIKRLVIKLGTSTLTYETGLINIQKFKKLVSVISDIKNSGIEVIIVSSGAIGLGVGRLKLGRKPADLPTKQACAAIGQSELMSLYSEHFSKYNHNVAQILLTKDVINDEIKHRNICNTFNRLFDFSVIPVINENDSISTNEIEENVFGDNDTLSAIVARVCNADALIILSDIDGLFDKDPNKYQDARIIPLVTEINDVIKELCGDTSNAQGTGGMITKISAAEICFTSNISMAIINGNRPENLYDIIKGENIGTWFKNK